VGRAVTRVALTFVTFEPCVDGFLASVEMELALVLNRDIESLLADAAGVYAKSVTGMRSQLAQIEQTRHQRTAVLARSIWDVGDSVFKLTGRLARLSLQLNGLYLHLMRDLGVRRMWLEKVIMFRRHVPKRSLVPPNLPWGRCSRTPRRAAELLSKAAMPG
jgi:hypothetical protein